MSNLIITGGTKGIGRAILERFALENFNCFTCSRNEADGKALTEAISKLNPEAAVYYIQADLSRKEECARFIDFVLERTNKIDVLINNAGVFKPGLIHNEEEGSLESMISINLYSAYHISRGFMPSMISASSGHIFNICSTASVIPYTNGGSYCISKFALLGMNKVLREEMKEHNIRVTAILPGATFTDSWEGVDLPEHRFMKAEDIGNSVYEIYKLSDQTVVEEVILRPQLGDI